MTPELPWLWAALLAYVFAGSLAAGGLVLGRMPERAVLAMIAVGLALHAASIGIRWERLGHGPFITMFEILSSNLWSLLFIYALAFARVKAIRPSAAFVLPALFIMMGWLLVTSPRDGHFPATYRTVWLYVHVGLGKVFLGAVLVSVGIASIVLARSWGIGTQRFARLPASERLSELAFRFLALGLVFETLMLITGAIWAQDAWGRYWAWDPLETWSFLTWLMLAFTLHLRATLRVGPPVGAALVIATFCVAFLTFFGVPFLSTAPHKGAV